MKLALVAVMAAIGLSNAALPEPTWSAGCPH
jgi:hypothetical protein